MRRVLFIQLVVGIILAGRLLLNVLRPPIRQMTSVDYVYFVLPDGFTGVFRLVEDPQNGDEVELRSTADNVPVKITQAVLSIPAGGELRLMNLGFLERWHRVRAAYETGAAIPWGDPHTDEAIPTVSLYNLGRESDSTKCIEWFLVGTRKKYHAVREDMTDLRVRTIER